MKATKHILALCLSLILVFSTIIASGVLTVSAIPGGGLPTTYYRAYGVDLSYWNGTVDFVKLKASGCQFAILRIGYEASASRVDTLDDNFVGYYNAARAAGMPVGLYFYSLATTYAGAKQDAEWVMSQIEKYDMYFEYPIYYDIEDAKYTNQVYLGSAAMEQLCLGWCETLEARGYFPGIYGGGSQVIDKLSSNFKSRYDLWYPRYASNYESNQHSSDDYDFSDYCGIWQYAIFGYYKGLSSTSVDMNVCYKNYPAIIKQYGYNNCGSPARTNLQTLVDEAANARHFDYTESQLTAFRNAYNNAVSVLANSSSSESTLVSAYNTLNSAYNASPTVISKGKSYTTNENNRTDKWADDKKRLTDGVKGQTKGDGESYVGWGEKAGAHVVIDLGGSSSHNAYKAYCALNTNWGIGAIASVSVSVSNDGVNFTPVATSNSLSVKYTGEEWVTYTVTAWAESARTERYVKFDIEPQSNHVWLDEVEVGSAPNGINAGIYVTGINKAVTSGSCVVFTPAFGTITTALANHSWTKNIIAEWNAASNGYVVKSVNSGSGPSNTASITLASNQILIAAHSWEGEGTTNPVYGSGSNFNIAGSAKVGDILVLNGIDVNGAKLSPAAYISIKTPHSHTPGEWTTVTEPEIGKEGLSEQRCTECNELLATKPIPALTAPVDVALGDVNNDGAIDQYDYILVKRHYFETRTLVGDEFTRGDVNKDAKVDQYDYILIARHYFGTYVIG